MTADGETIKAETLARFKAEVYSYYEQCGRTFPWRENTAPWGVLVSEFMLQQTQTERVIPYFERWMPRWPTPEALHNASLEEALSAWVGLGYNRRCRFLKRCAAVITEEYGGRVPETPETLRSLPGVGAYTAGAIACFAYNHPSVFIETNIRAAAIHFFYDTPASSDPAEIPLVISDREIAPMLESVLDGESMRNPRLWYWALMDYGANLKKLHVNPNRRSAHYTKQSKFEGSLRQIRGSVVRTLAREGASTIESLLRETAARKQKLYRALDGLQKDAMVCEHQGVYRIKG
ncbi:MAG: A/G-specific adenine glycosylase [Treponema sp.]|jgi:A/G-specific adenine glycosylase|nr:A/G-specific adenine glycosylase [Treponema sp.]